MTVVLIPLKLIPISPCFTYNRSQTLFADGEVTRRGSLVQRLGTKTTAILVRKKQPVSGCIGTPAAAIGRLPRNIHFYCSINEFG